MILWCPKLELNKFVCILSCRHGSRCLGAHKCIKLKHSTNQQDASKIMQYKLLQLCIKTKNEMGVQNIFQSCNRTPMRTDKRAQGKGKLPFSLEAVPFKGNYNLFLVWETICIQIFLNVIRIMVSRNIISYMIILRRNLLENWAEIVLANPEEKLAKKLLHG